MKSLLGALVLAVGLLPALDAQAPVPSPPLTNAALHAKVAALEQELATLQRDYQQLLTGCPSPSPAPADTEVADRLAATLHTAAIDDEQRLQQERLENESWYVKDLGFGVTEANRVFMHYAWKITVKNGIPRPQTFDVVVQFLDERDLVVDTARLYGQRIAAQDEQMITGDKLVSMPGALRVTQVKAVAIRKG
jgi:hypothetical protein